MTQCLRRLSLAWVVYEYGITLQQEVDMIWRRKYSAVTLLLVTTRYTMLLGPVAAAVSQQLEVRKRRLAFTYRAVISEIDIIGH